MDKWTNQPRDSQSLSYSCMSPTSKLSVLDHLTDRQTDERTDRETDRQTGRQSDKVRCRVAEHMTKNRAIRPVLHLGVPICKTLFYGDITPGHHGATYLKALTVFLFSYFAYLLFFPKSLFCPWFAYRCNHVIDFISFAIFVVEFESFLKAPGGVKLKRSLLSSINLKV